MALPDLSGRVAVITGASRGLGAGLAETFRAHGMRLALTARGRPVLADDPEVFAASFDVADEAAMQRFARDVDERFGRVDLWVNNAGVLEPIVPVRRLRAEDLRRHLDVNLFGVLYGCQAFLPFVDRQGEGVLINVSSGAAWHGYAGWAAYCASKAGVDRLTETLQLEEAGSGLRAHAVAPGVVDTAMQELIRSQDPSVFPEVERFRRLKEDGDFNTPSYVAESLLGIAFDPEARPEEVVVRLPKEGG